MGALLSQSIISSGNMKKRLKRIIKKDWIKRMILMLSRLILASSFLMGCAQLTQLEKNPGATALAGAAAGQVVKKVIDSAPKFNPYLQVKDFEVCILSKDDETMIECTLVLSHEKRKLPKERLEEGDTVFLKKESLLYLMSEIEEFCKAKPVECRDFAQSYKHIKRAFVF